MTDNVPGTVLNVSCPTGQKLTSGQNVMTAFCSRKGNWIPEIPECVGESRVLFFNTENCVFACYRFLNCNNLRGYIYVPYK